MKRAKVGLGCLNHVAKMKGVDCKLCCVGFGEKLVLLCAKTKKSSVSPEFNLRGNIKIFSSGRTCNGMKRIAELCPLNVSSFSLSHEITQKVLSIDSSPSLTPITLFKNTFDSPLSLVVSHSSLFSLDFVSFISFPSPSSQDFFSSYDWSSLSKFSLIEFYS